MSEGTAPQALPDPEADPVPAGWNTDYHVQVYMLCNLIAHTLGRELQMRATPRRSNNTAARACLWALERIGTLRKRLIQRAARITHPQGRLVLSFAKCPEAERDIRQLIHAASTAA